MKKLLLFFYKQQHNLNLLRKCICIKSDFLYYSFKYLIQVQESTVNIIIIDIAFIFWGFHLKVTYIPLLN